jgi:hypothetical protein
MDESKEDYLREIDDIVVDAQAYFMGLIRRLDKPLIFNHQDPKYKNHPLLPVIEKYVGLFPSHSTFVKNVFEHILSIVSGIFYRGDEGRE